MAWKIKFSDTARRQLHKTDKSVATRVVRFLEGRVAQLGDPRTIGEALHGPELDRYWKYRVGAYRIIAQIQDKEVTILVVRLGHRGDVYR